MFTLNQSYAQLGEAFYQSIAPTPVKNPELFLWNQPLADLLQLPKALSQSHSQQALYFSGNQPLDDTSPIALAYAGHQFGYFNPQLGDGRAHLLGERIDRHQQRQDIQLKGSGQTRFSRNGDGRCALGPAIREFIMSEAMHSLGVPTSRSLAVVTTGERVQRETPQPGAIVTRVATSHIRVGTFEYFAARKDDDALIKLSDYVIDRHFPGIQQHGPERYIELLKAVIERQIHLICEWMRVGFIHGVMNTDNTAISGETIDYGPCAMLGTYHPGTVYSSIDREGRYAYGNQPTIAQWNMARLAETLLPLIDTDQNQAIAQVGPLIEQFRQQFEDAYLSMLGRKLGLEPITSAERDVIQGLLKLMQEQALDYTHTFAQLTLSIGECKQAQSSQDWVKATLGNWFETWQQCLMTQQQSMHQAQQLMRQNNPVVIPRNHHMEAILSECITSGQADAATAWLKVLRSPYQVLPETGYYQDLPTDGDKHYQTFCGT